MDNMELDKEFQMYSPSERRNHQDDTYYNEYVRLYLANIVLTSQVKELIEEKNNLLNRLSKYEVTPNPILGGGRIQLLWS